MIKEIDVNNLLLDLMNYRLNDPVDQDDALRQIVQDQKEKLVKLATDIAQWGTNPSELSIVMASDEAGKYIVLEGNRRLTAVRLLTRASEFDKLDEGKIKENFRKLRHEYPQFKITDLQCIVMKDRDEAAHWLQLRHTGENSGVGTVKWNAQAASRFSEHMGKSTFNSIAMKVVKNLQDSPLVDPATKSKLENLKLTNLARLMNDTAVRDVVGIESKDGNIEIDLARPEVRIKLERIIDNVADPEFKVHTIYNKTDRAKYIETLEQPHQPGTPPPNMTEERQDSNSIGTLLPEGSDTPQTRATRSHPQSDARLTLIPQKTRMNIRHRRLNRIYDELRTLRVDDTPNSVAVMLRVFLELSMDEFSTDKQIPGFSKESRFLHNKIKAIANYMEAQNILSANELTATRVLADPANTHSLFSTHTLNAYVHNPDMAPIPNELKTTWDRIEKFVVKLWE